MSGELNFGIRITADGRVLVAEAGKAEESLKKLGAAAEQSFASASKFGLAIGASLAGAAIAAGAFAKSLVGTAASMDDLADSTGSSVENLSALRNQLAVSNVDFGTFETLVNKLAVGLAGLDEEGGKAARALDALGVKSKDPATAMRELATQLDLYADGANKAALMNEIFGRGAARYLGVMKDIAHDTQMAATMTTAFASEAERFEKIMARSKVATEELGVSIANTLLPEINKLLEQLAEGKKLAGGFGNALLTLGTINPFKSLSENLKSTRERIDSITNQEGVEARWASALGVTDNLMQKLRVREQMLMFQMHQEANSKFGNSDADARDLALAKAKPEAPNISGAKDGAQEVDEYKKALEGVNKLAAEGQLALASMFDSEPITKADHALTELMASDKWGKLTDGQQIRIMVEYDSVSEAEKELLRLQEAEKGAFEYAKKLKDQRKRDDQDQQDSILAIYKLVGGIELEAKNLALSNEQREASVALLKLENSGLDENSDEYKNLANRINSAAQAKTDFANNKEAAKSAEDFAKQWQRSVDKVRDDLSDAFLKAVNSGRNFFKSLANDLKQIFSQLVLRPIIQGVMAPVAGGITSMLQAGGAYGQSGSAGGMGGYGNYLSAGKSLYTMGDTSASMYAGGIGFAASDTGMALGLSTAYTDVAAGGAFATSAVVSEAGTALAGIAAAAPYIAAFIAVAYLAYEAFGQKPGGPKVGGYAISGSGMDAWPRQSNLLTGEQGHFTPAQMDSSLQPIADKWVSSLAAQIKAFGGTANSKSAFDIGLDKDPSENGTANNRLGIRASVNGKQVYNYWSGDSGLGRDDQSLQNAIQLESKRALLAALQASDLPSQIGAVFATMKASVATSDEIDNMMAFGSAMKSIIDSIGGSVVEDAQTAWEKSQRSAVEVLQDMGKEVVRLSGEMDGSTSSMQALATATGQYRTAAVQALASIQALRKSLGDMFANAREQIQFAGLTKQEQYNLYQSKGETLTGLLTATQDPAMVKQYADQINGYMLAAFNLLSPGEQLGKKGDFLKDLAAVEDAVGKRLTAISDLISADTKDPFAAANAALDSAAGKFDSAASKHVTAAELTMDAAKLMNVAAEKIDGATFTVKVQTDGSATGGG